MSLISVIVPVYKVEKFLNRCIDSILAQTFTDFELILVDDGSPDRCGEICDEYSLVDKRIQVIHQENKGLSAARNIGIDWVWKNSECEWITFIDSDDWVNEKYLEVLYNAAIKSNSAISSAAYSQTDGKSPWITVKEVPLYQIWKVEDYYIKHNLTATIAWGKLYQKECFKEIRYPVGKLHEDEFTTHKILFMSDKMAVVDFPLYAYYVNSSGISKSMWSPKRLDQLEALEERILYFSKRKQEKLKRHTIKIYLYVIKKQIQQIMQSRELKYQKYQIKLLLKIVECSLKHPKAVIRLVLQRNE